MIWKSGKCLSSEIKTWRTTAATHSEIILKSESYKKRLNDELIKLLCDVADDSQQEHYDG